MIKHIITDEAIIIPTQKETIQIAKDSPLFIKVAAICENPDNNIEQLEFLSGSFNYDDGDFSFSYNNKTNISEVYFNGKYYTVPKWFVDKCVELKQSEMTFRIKYAALFLKKIFSNFNVSWDILFNDLEKSGFYFNKDGDIIVTKEFEKSDQDNMFEEKLRNIENMFDKITKTFILVNPENITKVGEKLQIFGYQILKSEIGNCILKKTNGTFIES